MVVSRNLLRICAVILMALSICSYGCTREKKKELPSSDTVTDEIAWAGSSLKRDIAVGLFKKFNKYWVDRTRLDWHNLYELEAPHITWKYSEKIFRDFHRLAPVIKEVKVLEVLNRHKDVVDFKVTYQSTDVTTNKKRQTWVTDRWVRLKGKWYHVWKTPFLKFN